MTIRCTLTRAGVVLLTAALFAISGPTFASASEAASASVVDIQLPAGMTTGTLAGAPGSMSVFGCPADGSVAVRAKLSYSPLAVGGTALEIPILLVPAIAVPPDGVVSFPLAPISEWLARQVPTREYQVVIEAKCNPDGPWAERTVTADAVLLGTGGTPTPDPSATAMPPKPKPKPKPGPIAASSTPESDPSRAAVADTAAGTATDLASRGSSQATVTLAETGSDGSTLLGSVVAGFLLVLGGCGLLALRRHQPSIQPRDVLDVNDASE